MAQQNISVLAFNRGLVSPLALARVDLKRLELSAETSRNWLPRVLGSMSIRTGTKYLQPTRSSLRNFDIPFVFSTNDKAILELTDQSMRVLVDDVVISRPSVSSAITNSLFTSSLTGWTDADETGAVSEWVAGAMKMRGGNQGTTFARRYQTVSVTGASIGVEHALRIVIGRGPVIVKVGSALGLDDFISETTLGAGSHSLAFTPSGNFTVEFRSANRFPVLVNSCGLEAAGEMVLPAPWLEADLPLVRHVQSLDVIFVACKGYQQHKIERRATRSWSVVLFESIDGPYLPRNYNRSVFLQDSAFTDGESQLLTSQAVGVAGIFRPTDVGSLVRITTTSHTVAGSFSQNNSFTDAIKVTGTGATRIFTLVLNFAAGAGVGTIELQKSFTSADGPWETHTTYTTDQAIINIDDTLANQIVWYRLGFATGYSSGTVTGRLAYQNDTTVGVVRITNFVDDTRVDVVVVKPIGDVTPVSVQSFSFGRWSDTRGYPTAVGFFDGRLCWAGKDRFDASRSDTFDDYGEDEGDATPISRILGGSSTDNISWMLELPQLLLGGDGAEYTGRSSNDEEPITPTNFNVKVASSQGSAKVAAAQIDQTGIFVQRGGHRVFELSYGDSPNGSYVSSHISALVPEIGAPGIVKIVVQRQPDTRVHCIRSDGTVAVLVFDKVEKVLCWLELDSPGATGLIRDAVVLPGGTATQEDQVYYTVERTINGVQVHYRERFSLQSECEGGALCRLADSSVAYSGAATAVLTNIAPHLAGQQVVVWADSADFSPDDVDGVQATYLVSSTGTVTLGAAVSSAVVGLGYSARWKSAKLARATDLGSGLTQKKQVPYLGLVLSNTHAKGLRFGPSFDVMDPLPEVVRGALVGVNEMFAQYDDEPVQFPGAWDTDSRICLEARAPRPCTVLAAVAEVEQHSNR